MSVFNRASYSSSVRAVSTKMLMIDEEDYSDDNDTEQSPSTEAPLNRLIVRDLPFHQSSNSLRVRHQMSKEYTKRSGLKSAGGLSFFHWYIEDWFHVLLRLRTIVSSFMFVVVWTSLLLFFAAIYVLIDSREPDVACGLGKIGVPIGYYGAFAFALETTTTVGYGLPNGGNGFFENCPELQVVIYFQMLISMFFNAFLLSFIFSRLSRCEARASQVLFSDKAIINREVLPNGITRYMISARVYDADSMYPIVEAHCRFYAVKHRNMHLKDNRGVRFPLKLEPMRVAKPNDDWGELLYTSVPSTVMHHIDFYSPLSPPSKSKLGPEDGRLSRDSGFVADPCGLSLRESDSSTGGQDGLRCVVCGETYGTVANLIQHIRYYQHTEKHDDYPIVGTHLEIDVNAVFKKQEKPNKAPRINGLKPKRIDIDAQPKPWYEEYRKHLIESNIEVICVMEAIDPIMSGTFQAIQSYTIDDIVFDQEFAACVIADRQPDDDTRMFWWRRKIIRLIRRVFVGRSAVGRSIKIDLDTFHETVNVGEGCSER